jgi:hypothetical protein
MVWWKYTKRIGVRRWKLLLSVTNLKRKNKEKKREPILSMPPLKNKGLKKKRDMLRI